MEHLTRWDVFVGSFGAMSPLLVLLLGLHLQNRSDKKKSDEQLQGMLRECPPHGHDELRTLEQFRKDEPLAASGIRFPSAVDGSRGKRQ
jgi:hypothetical protein